MDNIIVDAKCNQHIADSLAHLGIEVPVNKVTEFTGKPVGGKVYNKLELLLDNSTILITLGWSASRGGEIKATGTQFDNKGQIIGTVTNRKEHRLYGEPNYLGGCYIVARVESFSERVWSHEKLTEAISSSTIRIVDDEEE